MSVHILGTRNQEGFEMCHFGPLKIWADRGMLHVEDTRDGDYRSVPLHDHLRRVKAINDMLGNSYAAAKDRGGVPRQEYERQMRAVEELVALATRAKQQGNPFDADVVQDRLRRLPQTVTVPDMGAMM